MPLITKPQSPIAQRWWMMFAKGKMGLEEMATAAAQLRKTYGAGLGFCSGIGTVLRLALGPAPSCPRSRPGRSRAPASRESYGGSRPGGDIFVNHAASPNNIL